MQRIPSLRLLAAVAFASSLVALPQAQSTSKSRGLEARVVRYLDRAFAERGAKKSTTQMRWRALRSIAKLHSAELLEARIRAYVRLDGEVRIMRARVMLGDTPINVHDRIRFRESLAEVDEMQIALRAQVDDAPASLADACLAALIRLTRTDESPFSLVLLLAKKARGFQRIEDFQRALRRARSPGAIVAYLRVLQGLGRRARVFFPWLAGQLASDSSGVRLEALRTARACRFEACVELLVSRLALERGRLRVELFATLELLTGKRLKRAHQSWLRFLEERRAAQSGEDKETAASAVKAVVPEAVGGDFFSIAQDGESALYILDRSGSMSRGMSRKRRESRFRVAKRELVSALESLGSQTRAQVAVFSSEVRLWKQDLRGFDRKRLREVKKWILRRDAGGATNTFGALAEAFRFAGSRGTDRYDEMELETVFLLSDGVPTIFAPTSKQGYQVDSTERILAAVRRWNPLGRVRIHTIALGEAESVDVGSKCS